MRFIFFATIALIVSSTATRADVQPLPSPVLPALQLRTGQRYPLEGLITHEFSLEPAGIARARETPEGIILEGIRPGETKFTAKLGDKNVSMPVTVKASAPLTQATTWPAALQELRHLPGLRLDRMNGKLFIQGEILGRSAYQKILNLLQIYPDHVVVLATAAPGLKASLMEQAQAALRAQGLNQVEVASAGHRFFLYGSVIHPSDVEQAFEIVRPLLPTIENRLPLPIHVEPTITIKVFMLELSKRAHKELGLSWGQPSTALARFAPGGSLFGPSFEVALRRLSTTGLAKVLAEPLLSVKLGSSAELSAGGEFPVKLTEKFENRVVWKYYGLKLRIHIAGVSGKRIRSRIETESSQLDSATAVGGIPGIRTNRLSTEIDATEGEPVLLTGLFQSSSTKDVEKIPVLGDIPILGELFKSRDFRKEESELLIALLPSSEAVRTRLPLQGVHGIDQDTSWKLGD